MIYFKHKQTNVIYKAHTLRGIFTKGGHNGFYNGGSRLDFDAVIASIVYGNVDSLWSRESMILQFLNDYEVLIPEYNVFGIVAEKVKQEAE